MVRWLKSLEPWGALLLRLVVGVAMVYYGHGKVIPSHGWQEHPLRAIEEHSHYVAGLGLPAWTGYVSALTEFVGGVLLLLGLLTRFAALMVAGNLLVAFFTVTLHRGYEASQYVIALIAMALMVLFVGGGALALDRRIGLE